MHAHSTEYQTGFDLNSNFPNLMWKSQSLTPCHCFPTPFSGLNVFKLWGQKAGWMWGEYEGLLGRSLWALGGGVEGEAMVKHGCLVVWIDPPPWMGPPQANFILHWAAEQRGTGCPLRPTSSSPLTGLGLTWFPEGHCLVWWWGTSGEEEQVGLISQRV